MCKHVKIAREDYGFAVEKYYTSEKFVSPILGKNIKKYLTWLSAHI